MFEIRSYRCFVRPQGLVHFRVVYKESDLQVIADKDLSKDTLMFLKEERRPLEEFILQNPIFLSTLKPIKVDSKAPDIVKEMAKVAGIAGVGPMAAVAGTLAERVGKRLLESKLTKEVVIENGGDIFLSLKREAIVAILAGNSPLSGKIGLKIRPEFMPLGVCTSSGTIGHSLSLGKADALCVLAPSASLADACATAMGNLVKGRRSFSKILNYAKKIPDIKGVVCIFQEELFIWGEWIELVPLNGIF